MGQRALLPWYQIPATEKMTQCLAGPGPFAFCVSHVQRLKKLLLHFEPNPLGLPFLVADGLWVVLYRLDLRWH